MSFQTGDILIKAEGICKQFGAVKALEDVSFTLRRGEIMGLAGHNGAGKSVLIKIMGGVYQPDRGRIWFNGEEVKLHSPRDAQERGYYIVPQELTVARQLSVADNIFIGRDEFASKYSGIVNKKYIYEKAAQLLREFFNIDVDPTVPVGELDTVTQRLIQVVRCLSAGAKVIVFDETTAGLSQRERDKLFQHIRILAEKGIGIIFISHILSEIMEMCDRVTVLREGKVIGIEEVQNLTIPKLIEMIAGREVRTNTCEKVFPA